MALHVRHIILISSLLTSAALPVTLLANGKILHANRVNPEQHYHGAKPPESRQSLFLEGSYGASSAGFASSIDTVVKVFSLTGAGGSETEQLRGTIDVAAGVTYAVTVEVLRDDFGSASEKVSSIMLDNTSLGACDHDGGVYDCTFFNCQKSNTITSTTGSISVAMTYTDHSNSCECDILTWECSQEDVSSARTPTRAAARFTLTPQIVAEAFKVLYLDDDGSNSTDETLTGSIPVVPGTVYDVKVHILRDDEGASAEYVKSIIVDGTGLGECSPDHQLGDDYECTFFDCDMNAVIGPTSSSVAVEVTLNGHSKRCDCDHSSGQCSKEDAIPGRSPTKAAARFTLTPRATTTFTTTTTNTTTTTEGLY